MEPPREPVSGQNPVRRSSFCDKVALITGGAGGIGLAVGEALAARGATIVLADRRSDEVESLAAALRDRGRRVTATVFDVRDSEAFRLAVNDLITVHGRLDYLFNNAGIGITGEVRDMSLDAWNRIVDINLRGVVHGIQAAYPVMLEQGFGQIANTACVAGLVPFPLTSAYCATKHAVVGLTLALRSEAANLGVKVNVICPGTVDTGMFEAIEYIKTDKQAILGKIQRVLQPPERCAEVILSGIERNVSVITIGWEARLAWWLYRWMPRSFLALTGSMFHHLGSGLRAPDASTGQPSDIPTSESN